MQIYLQTKVLKKLLIRAAAVFCCVLALLYFGQPKSAKMRENDMVNTHNTKYLSVSQRQAGKDLQGAFDKSEENDTKMNNEPSNNASKAETQIQQAADVTVRHDEHGANIISFPNKKQSISVYNHKLDENQDMDFEEYLIGCVCAEMPSAFDTQALMAQGVAARTFTLRKMISDVKDSHNGADICTDYRHCQSYISKEDYLAKGEYADEQYKKIAQAVNATKGVVMLYENEPINAVYHASSGIATKSSAEVWGGEIPYLVSVPAVEDKGVCAKSYIFSYEELSEKLSGYTKDSVRCFAASGIDVKGSAISKEVSISGVNFNHKQIKKALSLRSDYFDVKCGEDDVVFETYGYGHLVGMSQYGADALAKTGKGYLDILQYYYKGIEFGCIRYE